MNGAKEKAKEYFTKFAIYDWDENDGYIQNEQETKYMCISILSEMLELLDDLDITTNVDIEETMIHYNFLIEVREEIIKL